MTTRLPEAVSAALHAVTDPVVSRDRALYDRWWRAEARLVTDGRVACDGIAEIVDHYAEFAAAWDEVSLDVVWTTSGESQAAIEFVLSTRLRDGSVTMRRVLAVFVLDEGRIAELRQVSTSRLP